MEETILKYFYHHFEKSKKSFVFFFIFNCVLYNRELGSIAQCIVSLAGTHINEVRIVLETPENSFHLFYASNLVEDTTSANQLDNSRYFPLLQLPYPSLCFHYNKEVFVNRS